MIGRMKSEQKLLIFRLNGTADKWEDINTKANTDSWDLDLVC